MAGDNKIIRAFPTDVEARQYARALQKKADEKGKGKVYQVYNSETYIFDDENDGLWEGFIVVEEDAPECRVVDEEKLKRDAAAWIKSMQKYRKGKGYE